MFQQRQAGPDKPPIRAVFRDYAVYTNAYTNWDSTHYHTRARAERAVDLVALEISRLETGCQTIDPETFAREREVVRNEIRTVLGTPEAQVGYLLLEAVYPPGHPYRQPVGGDDEQLASITLDDVCKFMRDYYVPERAAFIVTVDCRLSTSLSVIVETLEAIPIDQAPHERLSQHLVRESHPDRAHLVEVLELLRSERRVEHSEVVLELG